MKINFMYHYNNHIRKPLSLKKKTDLDIYSKRKDFDYFLVLDDQKDIDFNQLKYEAFRKIAAEKNNDLAEF